MANSHFNLGISTLRGTGKALVVGGLTAAAGGSVGELLGVGTPTAYGLTAGASSLGVELAEAGAMQVFADDAPAPAALPAAPTTPAATDIHAQLKAEQAELEARLAYVLVLSKELPSKKGEKSVLGELTQQLKEFKELKKLLAE